MLVTSQQNELVKHARAVRDGRNRNSIFIEGIRLCEEAGCSGLTLEAVLYAEKLPHNEYGQRVLNKLAHHAHRVMALANNVFNSLSDTEVHQGLAALARTPRTGPQLLSPEIDAAPLFVVLHQLNNPSNAGAILRAAEAAGVNGVIATAGTTYLFAPKALRGAMGAAFRLPVWMGATLVEVTDWCERRGVRMVCADVRATQRHDEIDWTQPVALVMGSEAHGLNEAERSLMAEFIRIPMRPPVESLNVAVAAGIALYEAARQRDFA